MAASPEQLVEQLQDPEGEALLAAIRAAAPAVRSAPREIARLRRSWSAELVQLALRVTAAGERAPVKFPDAERLIFTPELLEMASAHPPALHRARRAAGLGRTLDLGCGAGGDLTRLAGIAAEAPVALERDPLAASLARANLARLGLAGQVLRGSFPTDPLPSHDLLFVDPSRRSAGRRAGDPGRFSPPPEQLAPLLARSSAFALKWGPAFDIEPEVLGRPGAPFAQIAAADVELELISWRGEVKEAVFWGGDARLGVPRQATLLTGSLAEFETHLFRGDAKLPPPPLGGEPGWIVETDGAIIRAGLLAAFAAEQGCTLLAEGIAYLGANAPCPRPFARSWPLIESLPFSLTALQASLDRLGAGHITLKKRGFPLDPEELRPRLRLRGDRHLTVLIHRVDGGHRACICGPEYLPEAGI